MRFGRQNSDDSGEEEMYERAESELTATRLPRKAASEATHLPPRPAKKVNPLAIWLFYVTVKIVCHDNIITDAEKESSETSREYWWWSCYVSL